MAEADIESDAAGPLVRLRLVPSRWLWRIGPAWSVLAGAMAAGVSWPGADALFRLAAAVILADLLWGALRHLVPLARGETRPAPAWIALPYASADAPLATLLAGLADPLDEAPRAAWQALLLGLALIGAASALLGSAAVLLSVLVLLMLPLMRGWAQRTGGADFGQALLDVLLPWVLGASLAGTAAVTWQVWVLAVAFTLLQWGGLRAGASRFAPAWLGQGAVIVALAALQQAWALVGVAALFAPPAWWLAARRAGALIHVLPWWWGAMLVAALAVR